MLLNCNGRTHRTGASQVEPKWLRSTTPGRAGVTTLDESVDADGEDVPSLLSLLPHAAVRRAALAKLIVARKRFTRDSLCWHGLECWTC